MNQAAASKFRSGVRRFIAGSVVAGVVCLLSMRGAPAERLRLANGNEVVGKIEAETLDRITIRTAAGTVSFPRTAITSIDRQSEAEDILDLVTEALAKGDLEKALSSVPADASPKLYDQIDAAILAGEHALLAGRSPSRHDSVRLKTYVELRKTVPSDFLRLFLVRYLYAAGDSTGAVKALRSLDQNFLLRNQTARKLAADLLLADISGSMERGLPEQGLESLDLLSVIAPERMTSSTAVLLRLRETQRLADQGAFVPAAEELGVFVLPYARATALEEMTALLTRAEKLTSASVLVQLYDTVYRHLSGAGFRKELIPICERHISALLHLNRIQDARIVASRLSRIAPDIGAPAEHRVELAARQSAISPDDYVAEYRLGVWAREVGLYEEARLMLRRAQHQPGLHDNATLQLELLENEYQRLVFETACEHLKDKQYEPAKAALDSFQANYPDSQYAKRAGELAEIARYHLWHVSARRPEEAEVLRQNAERLYLQGRYHEALELLNQVEVDFRGTAAANEADKLRKMIRQQSKNTEQVVGSPRPPPETRRMAEIRAMALDLVRKTEH